MDARRNRPEAADEAEIRGGDLAAFGPPLSRALPLHGELGDGRDNARPLEPAGGGRFSVPAAGPVPGGDDGPLASREARVAAPPGAWDPGACHGRAPADSPAPPGARPRFLLVWLLLGALFFLGLRQAGRGYAELTGETLPSPLAFSRSAPYRYSVHFYDLRLTVNLAPLAREARVLAATAVKKVAPLFGRLRPHLGPLEKRR
ncbi:MAG: hypothetical protein ACUVRM_01605 [Bacillota bacterium]